MTMIIRWKTIATMIHQLTRKKMTLQNMTAKDIRRRKGAEVVLKVVRVHLPEDEGGVIVATGIATIGRNLLIPKIAGGDILRIATQTRSIRKNPSLHPVNQ
jgi:hypothetical protein